LEALNRLDEEALLASLHNDFEEWALKTYPEIAAVKQILEESGGKALLTGSGAAVFGLYDRPEAAQLAARQVKRAGLWAEMARFVPTTGFVAEGLMQLGLP
jgi:4-diphosphocytidyl-2C-methyl-D-erythritol kinase